MSIAYWGASAQIWEPMEDSLLQTPTVWQPTVWESFGGLAGGSTSPGLASGVYGLTQHAVHSLCIVLAFEHVSTQLPVPSTVPVTYCHASRP